MKKSKVFYRSRPSHKNEKNQRPGSKRSRRKKYSSSVIVIDEFGDYGKKYDVNDLRTSKKTFGFGISVVNDEKKFRNVSKSFKEKKGIRGELKAKKRSPEEKTSLATDIAHSGAKTYGYYIDKTKDVPDYWISKDRSDAAIPLLKHSLMDVFKRTKSKNLEVVIDRHEVYKDKSKKEKNFDLAEKAVKDMGKETNKKVDVVIPSSDKKGRYGELLQTNDVVSNSIFESVEKGNDSLVTILKTKIIRIMRKV